ncbi:hypothetical protein CR532_01220 [Candidatus Borreliella tachyglossi]|uniref:Uncharacterized protein n=1 Tax=Candidatus Borreliella tachyglossi TaxID=1964448 RepID=A0A2S1LY35_9SPIR|nr:hypothetical protein [Candidatus Borreliella tachyglossi]AWG43209.1 hypothetical protein CR532_01220 [Candidatus Borreliella tachyglossi]
MRKLVVFLNFYLAFVNLFASSSVIDDKQKELAIFYHEVGQRYIDVGKVAKGKNFQKKALEIYPRLREEIDLKVAIEEIDSKMSLGEDGETRSLALEDIRLDDIPGIAHDIIEINEITNAPKIRYIAERERERHKEQAVKFQFNKFARALVLQNLGLLNSIMADEVKISEKVESRDSFIAGLKRASGGVNKDDLDYLSVDDFYDLRSLKIVKGKDASYNVQVKTKKNNVTKGIPFWSGGVQTLGFAQQGDKWILSSIK